MISRFDVPFSLFAHCPVQLARASAANAGLTSKVCGCRKWEARSPKELSGEACGRLQVIWGKGGTGVDHYSRGHTLPYLVWFIYMHRKQCLQRAADSLLSTLGRRYEAEMSDIL